MTSSAYLRPATVIVDLTTAAPGDKQTAFHLAAEHHIQYVDAVILGAIALTGAATPLLAAGPAGAEAMRDFAGLGAPVRVLPQARPGDAAALKLLRTILTKGLEALAVECLVAAEKQGIRTELYEAMSTSTRPVSPASSTCWVPSISSTANGDGTKYSVPKGLADRTGPARHDAVRQPGGVRADHQVRGREPAPGRRHDRRRRRPQVARRSIARRYLGRDRGERFAAQPATPGVLLRRSAREARAWDLTAILPP